MSGDELEQFKQRLCQVLTWGLNEIQSRLVLPAAKRRIQELANTIEVIPPMLTRDITDEDIELVQFVLRTYQENFPDTPYPYLAFIEEGLPTTVA